MLRYQSWHLPLNCRTIACVHLAVPAASCSSTCACPLAMHETQAGLHIIYRDREQTDQGGGFIAQVTIGMALT